MTFTTRHVLPVTTLVLALSTIAPRPAASQDAAKGEQVYAAQKCQVCHAVAGKGGKTSALDGVGAKLSAAEIRQWITNPAEMTAKTKSTKKPPMPAKWGNLPAPELESLVAYMVSLK
jgi:mono/diheme cytochrome c family protein